LVLKDGYTANYSKSGGNPNQFLGQRKDLTPIKMSEIAKKFINKGATILGGCCETRPAHIQELSNLKR
jgi:homocysteine S-methyltransferase